MSEVGSEFLRLLLLHVTNWDVTSDSFIANGTRNYSDFSVYLRRKNGRHHLSKIASTVVKLECQSPSSSSIELFIDGLMVCTVISDGGVVQLSRENIVGLNSLRNVLQIPKYGPLNSELICATLHMLVGCPVHWPQSDCVGDSCVVLWRWWHGSRGGMGLPPELIDLISQYLEENSRCTPPRSITMTFDIETHLLFPARNDDLTRSF